MEFKNYIEIVGIVGRTSLVSANGTEIMNLSVITESARRDRDGNAIVDVTWFSVTAYSTSFKNGLPPAPSKGDWVRVTGSVRNQRYTREDGSEGYHQHVIANTLEILQKEK